MTHTVSQMTEDDPDWEPLFRTFVDAYEKPPQRMFRLYRTGWTSPDEEEASFQEFFARMRQAHSPAEGSFYQKVTSQNGAVVGGALWVIHHAERPFDDIPADEGATWYPEGGQREFVNACIERFEKPRMAHSNRPHIFLYILWADPKQQRKGVGKAVLDWGVKKAEELDYEMWLDASEYGLRLYEQYGFQTLLQLDIRAPEKLEDAEWTKLRDDIGGPMIETTMWRPRPSQMPYVEGKSVKPWEV